MTAKKRKTLRSFFITIVFFFVAAVIAAISLLQFMSQPVNGQEIAMTFVIPRGQAVRTIARRLEEAKLVRSQWVFTYTVWRLGLTGKIQAGTYTLSPSMNVSQVAETLTQGSDDALITIPEGLRAEEIGEIIAEQLPGFSVDDDAFIPECHAYEGKLFPETYRMPRTYTTAETCLLLRQQFDSIWTPDMNAAVDITDLSQEEVITLASIVQREAKNPSDMKAVAGILLNRLRIGMPLQVDATLQYIKGYNEAGKTWWSPPTAADKALKSPYNTYLNAGLPPGPIANPGTDALSAVLFSTKSDNLYYISDRTGQKMYYAETYDQHLQNIERYLR